MASTDTPLSFLMRRTPKLTPDETREMFRRWRVGGEDLRGEIISGSTSLAIYFARKFRREDGPPLEDLVADAIVALIESVDLFHGWETCLFSTYAIPRIVGALKRSRIREDLCPLGVQYSCESLTESARAVRDSAPTVRRFADFSAESAATFDPADDEPEPSSSASSAALADELLGFLDPVERGIVGDRFGLGGRPALNDAEIAGERGVTPPAIKARVARILAKLRRAAELEGRGSRLSIKRTAPPISRFARERCRLGAGLKCEVRVLYREWEAWCRSEGLEPRNVCEFGKAVLAEVPGVVSRQQRFEGRTTRLYIGLSLAACPRLSPRRPRVR